MRKSLSVDFEGSCQASVTGEMKITSARWYKTITELADTERGPQADLQED